MAINEAETKLAQYRAKKQREALFNKAKTALFGRPKVEHQQQMEPFLVEFNKESEEIPSFVEENGASTALDYVQYCLYFVLWATIYGIFIKLEFGTVYLLVSMILGIYLNTGTRKKGPKEPSAYSVFNENCESIPGALDAEQMTRQMIYGF